MIPVLIISSIFVSIIVVKAGLPLVIFISLNLGFLVIVVDFYVQSLAPKYYISSNIVTSINISIINVIVWSILLIPTSIYFILTSYIRIVEWASIFGYFLVSCVFLLLSGLKKESQNWKKWNN